MLDRRLSLTDWLKIPGNIELYRDWVSNPVTQDIVELVERSFRPSPISANVEGKDLGPYCSYLHGEFIGATKCLQRLMLGDAFLEAGEREEGITKGELDSLTQQGYTQAEVDARLKAGDFTDG